MFFVVVFVQYVCWWLLGDSCLLCLSCMLSRVVKWHVLSRCCGKLKDELNWVWVCQRHGMSYNMVPRSLGVILFIGLCPSWCVMCLRHDVMPQPLGFVYMVMTVRGVGQGCCFEKWHVFGFVSKVGMVFFYVPFRDRLF